MAPEELLVDGSLILLLASVVILVANVLRRPINRKALNGFSVLMLVFVTGWFSTDLLSGWNGGALESLANLAYLLVLIVFAAALTMRLSWAFKRAGELPLEESGPAGPPEKAPSPGRKTRPDMSEP